jgi:hypothetical protein
VRTAGLYRRWFKRCLVRLGEKGSPTVRARVTGFLKIDGSVAGEQLPGFDRTRAGTLAIWADVRLFGGASLFGGRILAELPSDLAADLMSALFDGVEIELVQGFVGAEDILGDCFEDLLETRVNGCIRRRRAKHGWSSVTESSSPDARGV